MQWVRALNNIDVSCVLLVFMSWVLRLLKFWLDLIWRSNLHLGRYNPLTKPLPTMILKYFKRQFICMDLLVVATLYYLRGLQLWRSLVLFEKHDITVEICPSLQSCFSCPYTLHGNFRIKEGRHCSDFRTNVQANICLQPVGKVLSHVARNFVLKEGQQLRKFSYHHV